jgi:lipoprotein-releasing system permease protein
MLVVSGFNMISGLLILILDRTNMIGILKALGTTNKSIMKIFLYQAAYMILKGLFWGNLLGLLVCFIQKKYELIKLDPTSYYLSTVPINIDSFNILVLNFGTIAIIMIALLLPSMLITRISPAQAIRFN